MLSAVPAPSSPGTRLPSSPRRWLSKSPPPTHPTLSRRGFSFSTASDLLGQCGQLHLPPNAPFAGALDTPPPAARKASPTHNAAAYVVTSLTQPEPTHATNATQNQPCRRSWTVSVHTPLPTTSTVREITQPILHYVLSVWKRLRNSARMRINCNWSEALLPVKMPRLETDPRHCPPPQSPTPRRLRPGPSSPRQPLPSFTVVSLNCAGSLNHLHSFFSMMTDNPPDIVLVQEPQTRLSSTFRVPGYTLVPPQVPTSENRKPYACIYVSTTFQQSFAFIPIAIPRPDLVGIRCTPKNAAASANNTGTAPDATPWSISIFSCYNRAVRMWQLSYYGIHH